MRFCFILLCVPLLIPGALYAKRIPPKPVKPVSANGVTYSAEGDGRKGYVVATDTSTQKELWRVQIFMVHIKFWIEEDVQWVYITDLRITGDVLLVRDERAKCYAVGLRDKRVKSASCPDEWRVVSDTK